MYWLYQIFVNFYTLGLRMAAPFNPKARRWVQGRKHLISRIRREVITDNPIVWFHCASLGEFEQGRPVMEELKANYPGIKIFLTFFSPSGYEVRKNYPGADWVYYLPSDTRHHARELVRHLKPVMAFFVKYEFWFNYIDALYKMKVPTLFFSVIFRPSQHYFSWWGGWFRRQFQKVTYFFVQDDKSADLLESIGVNHAEVAGDTRFDRVLSLVNNVQKFEKIEAFKNQSPLLVGGSTWPVDEDLLLKVMQQGPEGLKLLLAPHLVDEAHIHAIQKKFASFHPEHYTQMPDVWPTDCRVLIVNTIGLLSQLYQYANLAYVGGGFGVGIHNLPEAAAYGVPVVFGPNHLRFKEAIDLKQVGGGIAVSTEMQGVEVIIDLLKNNTKLNHAGSCARNYIREHAGATSTIMDKSASYLAQKTRTSL